MSASSASSVHASDFDFLHGSPATPGSPMAEQMNEDHRPIMAERFKTKMCRNYERTGMCPYVHRCMFAHGEHELRSVDMNMMDGLIDEDAIFLFKKVNFLMRINPGGRHHAHRAYLPHDPYSHPASNVFPTHTPNHPAVRTPATSHYGTGAVTHVVSPASTYLDHPSAWRTANISPLPFASSSSSDHGDADAHRRTVSPRPYRHDPYAERSTWHPLPHVRA